jgi:hypothetical protein
MKKDSKKVADILNNSSTNNGSKAPSVRIDVV